jgi:AraC family L-rhamnose operon regulatory protein RhaS
VLSGISTIGYWDAKNRQDWGLDWHRNEGIEITFLETGGLSFSVEQSDFALQPGHLTITRPWQRHRVGSPHVGAGRLYWIIIDVGVRQPHQTWNWPDWLILSPQDLQQLTTVLRHNEHPVWPAGNELLRIFQKIGEAVEKDVDGSEESRLRMCVNEVLLLMIDLFREQDVDLCESLTDARRSVEFILKEAAHNLHFPWTLELMAEKCDLGITRFTHYCKLITNMTPARYLSSLRLEAAAKRLLDDSDQNITDIALECGFSSSQHFATRFKQEYGYSPRAYRLANNGLAA